MTGPLVGDIPARRRRTPGRVVLRRGKPSYRADVLTEPADLDSATLVRLLQGCWGLRDVALEFLPLGFGSHHWRAGDRFVTVDDLAAGHQAMPDPDSAFAALDRAYRTAAALRDEAELDFVIAPLPDAQGAVLRRVSERYAVSVAPLIDGESSEWGPYETADERRLISAMLGRLHGATRQVPAGLARTEDFAIPSRGALEDALRELGRPWTTGPFAEPARRALGETANSIERRLRDYDELVASARMDIGGWVVTHGEPHRANVVRGPNRRRYLVDWDTTLIAPRERDLHMVLDHERTGWDEYRAVVATELDDDMIRLYRTWWALADIAVFVQFFRAPHEQSEQSAASWRILDQNLAGHDD